MSRRRAQGGLAGTIRLSMRIRSDIEKWWDVTAKAGIRAD